MAGHAGAGRQAAGGPAYLRAADVATDPTAKRAYRGLARATLTFQTTGPQATAELSLEAVEADLRRELADADAWFAELRAKEIGWIAAGADPDAEFAKLYAADPETPGDGSVIPGPLMVWWRQHHLAVVGLAGAAVLLLGLFGVSYLTIRWVNRWAEKSAPPAGA